jgi:hypothetical protein
MYKLESANCDIEPAQLFLERGGDGDIYVTIQNEKGRHAVRICYSGGPDREIGIRQIISKLCLEFERLDKEINGKETEYNR